MPMPDPNLDGAGGARSIEKSDISSWHYATSWFKRELAGRDIRSQRTWSKFEGKDSCPWLP
jgi:hypothetical protein